MKDYLDNLDTSMFRTDDIINHILQRSEVLFGVPGSGRLVRAWVDGNETPLRALAQERISFIIKRVFDVIATEFSSIEPFFDDRKISRSADNDCGYAIFDLFLCRKFKCDLTLLDTEHSVHRGFGFSAEGAAYSNLQITKQFLVSNAVPKAKIITQRLRWFWFSAARLYGEDRKT